MRNLANDLRARVAARYVAKEPSDDARLMLDAAAELDRLQTRLSTYKGLWADIPAEAGNALAAGCGLR